MLLNVARNLADLVAEDVFIARRALEIYQLEDASSVRFDYGHSTRMWTTTSPSRRSSGSSSPCKV